MTPPDLTQPQRLDLEEGKRLLSEWRETPLSSIDDDKAKTEAWHRWRKWRDDNAEALIAAAEEAEKLREALQQARSALRTVQPLHVEDGLALNNDSVIRHALSTIDATLTPPEPLSAQQETP